jgi:hypothetical protein
MIQRNRINALTRTSLAVIIGVALEACGAGTHPAPTAQTPDPPARPSDARDPGSGLPEIVVSARRLRSPPMAAGASSGPAAKRRGS